MSGTKLLIQMYFELHAVSCSTSIPWGFQNFGTLAAKLLHKPSAELKRIAGIEYSE
jgi:hypothetical protein